MLEQLHKKPGIRSKNEELLDLNRRIFHAIKREIEDLEETGYINYYDEMYRLSDEFYEIFDKLHYCDSDNIKAYFEKLLDSNLFNISVSVYFKNIDLDLLEDTSNKLLGLHLELQSNIMNHEINGLEKPLFDRDIKENILFLYYRLDDEKLKESDIKPELNELLSDIDRTLYSKSVFEYKANKNIQKVLKPTM